MKHRLATAAQSFLSRHSSAAESLLGCEFSRIKRGYIVAWHSLEHRIKCRTEAEHSCIRHMLFLLSVILAAHFTLYAIKTSMSGVRLVAIAASVCHETHHLYFDYTLSLHDAIPTPWNVRKILPT